MLTRFWRKGQLVTNKAHGHPYQTDVPEEFKSRDRWFLLDTGIDPPRPRTVATELPVFSLALVMGQPGEREWLIYAHSPLGARQNVKVTIPDHRQMSINPPPQGIFYHVDEKTGDVRAIEVGLLPVSATQPVETPKR